MIQAIDWVAIAPPLALLAGGVLALLGDAFVPRARRWLPVSAGFAGVVVAGGYVASLANERRLAFCLPAEAGQPVSCSWIVDHVTLVWWGVVLVATGLVVLLLHRSAADDELPAGELFFLLLASATGALSLAAAGDLITLLVAMETVSLPAFAMVGLRRGDRRGAEAALKFFIASVVATAFTLFGITMVYGATGSIAAGQVASVTAAGEAVTPVIGIGMALTLVGLGFKVAAVPFQVWVPDTYVGAPIPVAAYLSVVSKAAGLAGIGVVVVRHFPSYADTWGPVLAASAALTMTVGNLAALRQQHAVRLLAWSSVAQAGYLLVPLAAGGSAADLGALQAYAAMYAVVNLGAFAVVLAGAAREQATTVADYAGLVRRNPWLAVALGFALLCLAGLPPGVVGLLAKLVVFQSAVDADLVWLAVVMAVNVAIGLVYYLRFLVVLFVREPAPVRVAAAVSAGGGRQGQASHDVPAQGEGEAPARLKAGLSVDLVVGLTLVAAVVMSVVPGLLFNTVYR